MVSGKSTSTRGASISRCCRPGSRVRVRWPDRQLHLQDDGGYGQFPAHLYLSADTHFDADPTVDIPVGDSVTLSPSGSAGFAFGTFNLSVPITVTKDRPYLLVVANPDKAITESDGSGYDTNNVAVVTLPTLDVVIDPSNPGPTKVYPITSEPKMPTVPAHASVNNVPPTVIATAQFMWTASIHYVPTSGMTTTDNKPLIGKEMTSPSVVGYVTGDALGGSDFTLRPGTKPDEVGFTQGGNLTFKVKATIAGFTVEGISYPALITATNPVPSEVKSYINSFLVPPRFSQYAAGSRYNYADVIMAIGSYESSNNRAGPLSQFANATDPFWSSDGQYGAGIMQLTPASTSKSGTGSQMFIQQW